jgi:hypothetical protein
MVSPSWTAVTGFHKEEIMGIHSKILVHWTGKKDIEVNPENERPRLYYERLRDYYQKGLYAKRATEDSIRTIKNLIRICFTEIRLSQSQTHAERYGKLGIVFARDFIMNKGGRSVIYIPYEADKCLLEDSIRDLHKKSEKIQEICRSVKYIMTYVKRMSDGRGEDYYEEMEWRLVQDESNNVPFTSGEKRKIWRLKFNADDVKVIIFPDEETKKMAVADTIMKDFFSKHTPIMATLKDCDNF